MNRRGMNFERGSRAYRDHNRDTGEWLKPGRLVSLASSDLATFQRLKRRLPSSLPPCTYVATRWYIGGGRVSPIPWTGRKASPSKRYPPSWEEHAFRDVNWNVPTKPPPPPQRRWKICVRDNRMEGLARGWRDVGVTWIGSIGGSFAWRGIFDQPLEGVGYVGTR